VTDPPPTLWFIAGPNGVGKTTYARRFLRSTAATDRFVNLDEIARGLSPLSPTPDAETARAAARVALARVAAGLAARASFAIETTLAGRTHLGTITAARAKGFRVRLIFAIVPDVALCLRRIADRVAAGGHAVPEADARRRFDRAIANFPLYAAQTDRWQLLDTQRLDPRLVASGEGASATIADQALFDALPERLRCGLAAMTGG
jgi:predicted ABC-type ATPase